MAKRYLFAAVFIVIGFFCTRLATYVSDASTLQSLTSGNPLRGATWIGAYDRASWFCFGLGAIMILIQFWHHCAGCPENGSQGPKGVI
jgi:hypothetical protein